MAIGIKRTQRDYTLALKLAVVLQIECGDLTYKTAQKRYGIQGRSTVLIWLRKQGHMDWVNLTPSDLILIQMMKKPALPQTPEQRIKALEVKLKEANLKVQLSEAMLDIIKTEYGVKLPKKPLSVSLKKGKLFY